jgi:hypothetical protein
MKRLNISINISCPYLKWIPQASKPVEDVTIKFYTSSFPMSMAMFVKNAEKATLEATFQEALKIEKKYA